MNLRFPIKGLHRGFVTEDQPQFTSPDLKNVRPYDTLDQRARGGQRPGLDKAYAEQIGGAAQPIAELTSVTVVDAVVDPEATKQGYVTNNTYLSYNSVNWAAQTFLTGTAYRLTKVQLYCRKVNSPGDVVLSIRAVDGTGKPTGADLATCTVAAAALGTSLAWVDFVLSTPIILAAATSYAIVVRSPTSSGSNSFGWGGNNPATGADTVHYYSTNSGSTWGGPDTRDANFRTLGRSFTLLEQTYSKHLVALGNDQLWYEDPLGTMGALSSATGQLDTAAPLGTAEAFEKIVVANGLNLNVADFGNIKLSSANIGANPPDFHTLLTGGTSGAQMYVDYITALSGACAVYGKRITVATFSSGETVTGTDDDGNAISFTISANEAAGPFWYDYTTYGDSAAFGALPEHATLACLYRGRLVLAGNYRFPFQWYMSRQGNIFDWAYTANDPQSPVAGGLSDAGEIGGVITALIPYKDDYLIFGSSASIYYLIGDPMAGGAINELSLTEGILGPKAWCWDGDGNLYLMSTSGLLRLGAGFTALENLTAQSYPKFMEDLDYDPSTDRIVMAYDRARFSIIIGKTTAATGVNKNYVFPLRTGGLFPEEYPEEASVFSAFQYDSTDPDYTRLLLGSNDGYIRFFDDSAKDDDIGATDEAINSYVTFGPIPLSNAEDGEGMIGPIVPVLAGGAPGGGQADSSNVAFKVFVGRDSETVVEQLLANGTARISGTYRATGRRRGGQDIRSVRGAWAGIRVGNSAASQTWAMESLKVTVTPMGRIL